MTGPDLRAALAELGLTGYAFAVECRVNPSTVYKWLHLKPGAYVPGYVETIVELLRENRRLRRAA
jgi:predicted transcriptional regulator